MESNDRREILRLFGVSGVVFASGLWGCAEGPSAAAAPPTSSPASASGPPPVPREDFFFLQLSDTHWGFSGPPNPEADKTLVQTVATINASPLRPAFIMFTGDLTHKTDDAEVRRKRLREFRAIVGELTVKDLRFIPGEHDAGLDGGAAYRELFGDTYYAFDHGGIHFVALDNVSAPGSVLGETQLAWLAHEVERTSPSTPLVVFTHRPLFDLAPAWDWTTKDGAKALEILGRHPSVTVFYGHIHQEHHHDTGNIRHHAARSLIFPMTAPGSVPDKAPLPWDPQSADHGLGYRSIESAPSGIVFEEHVVGKAS